MACSMIILSGGKSSRMGRDKAELLYRGKTFLEIQMEKGRQLGIEDILVSGYKGTLKANVVPDRFAEQGPLGGLCACLAAAKEEWSLVVTVDMPLIPPEELARLLAASSQSCKKAVILKTGEQEQPLIGVYHKSLVPLIEKNLAQNRRAVFHVLNEAGYDRYESRADPALFFNVNEPQDYAALC